MGAPEDRGEKPRLLGDPPAKAVCRASKLRPNTLGPDGSLMQARQTVKVKLKKKKKKNLDF